MCLIYELRNNRVSYLYKEYLSESERYRFTGVRTRLLKVRITPLNIFQITIIFILSQLISKGCPRGVMVKAMDCGIAVSEFVLQTRYYVNLRTNTLGKGMNPLSLVGYLMPNPFSKKNSSGTI